MKKAIIFGAGYVGSGSIIFLSQLYDIIGFADNNSKIWGENISGYPIISPLKLYEYNDKNDVEVIIAMDRYHEVAKQLYEMGINELKVLIRGFLYYYICGQTLIPVEVESLEPYKKDIKTKKSILFAQPLACIRTHKIATILKEAGFEVCLVQTFSDSNKSNDGFYKAYDKVYKAYSLKQMIDFVNQSEFDVVHSSNAPDDFTNILLKTNKKVIHDTHDMESIQKWGFDADILAMEYIANVCAAGNMYTSEMIKNYAVERFMLQEEKCFVLENTILDSVEIINPYEKLSKKDGTIHCVYEGGIVNRRTSFRYLEDIFKKIAGEGIHIHIYSHQCREYLKDLDTNNEFIHYEGDMGTCDLIPEMTKYDCGLAIFNVTDEERFFLESGSANKVYEYLNAGLPVAVGDIQSYITFVKKYQVGDYINLDGKILDQIKKLCSIKIADRFLEKNELTMKLRSEKIVEFYYTIIDKIS